MKTTRRTTFALASAALLPLALAGCTEKSTASTDDITVTANDDTCDVSADSGTTGKSTFQVTNNGSKVTEFYVFAEGDRAMGEVENIGPGLTRQLIVSLPDAGTYQLACKPGMVGNGIRQDFTVTGDSMSASDESGQLAEAADGYRRYIRSQVVALQDTTQQFVDAVKAGNVEQAKALFPVSRTYYERIEPEAESFRSPTRHQRDRRPTRRRRPVPRRPGERRGLHDRPHQDRRRRAGAARRDLHVEDHR